MEPYKYRSEAVTNGKGDVVDTALYRIQRNADGTWQDWSEGTFRGTGQNFLGRPRRGNTRTSGETNDGSITSFRNGPGTVRQAARGASGRGASRNPAMKAQISRDRNLLRATNRNLRGGRRNNRR